MDDLYVSSVAGAAVARFSLVTRRAGLGEMIGATRSREDPTRIVWDEEAITLIPGAEYQRYLREYNRALREKSLRRRTKAEFDAYTNPPAPIEPEPPAVALEEPPAEPPSEPVSD